jgi:hypothetical protein
LNARGFIAGDQKKTEGLRLEFPEFVLPAFLPKAEGELKLGLSCLVMGFAVDLANVILPLPGKSVIHRSVGNSWNPSKE